MTAELEFTGERFVPGVRGPIWIEHWHRYHFAAPWARGKRVLDIACGEGYGSALLAREAASVTGVDISADAIAHARRAYADVANVDYRQGSCTAIPLPDASVDLAVSFETIEHIHEQAAFVAELARVLAPDGVLLLSSPDKAEYSDKTGFANEFHVRELYRDELRALVAARFPHLRWFGQKPTFFSVIAPEDAPTAGALVDVGEDDPSRAGTSLPAAVYHLVAASRSAAALQALPATLHVLADRGDWVWLDYQKVMRWMKEGVAHREQLQRELDARDATIAELRAQARREPAASPPRGLRAWLAGLLR